MAAFFTRSTSASCTASATRQGRLTPRPTTFGWSARRPSGCSSRALERTAWRRAGAFRSLPALRTSRTTGRPTCTMPCAARCGWTTLARRRFACGSTSSTARKASWSAGSLHPGRGYRREEGASARRPAPTTPLRWPTRLTKAYALRRRHRRHGRSRLRNHQSVPQALDRGDPRHRRRRRDDGLRRGLVCPVAPGKRYLDWEGDDQPAAPSRRCAPSATRSVAACVRWSGTQVSPFRGMGRRRASRSRRPDRHRRRRPRRSPRGRHGGRPRQAPGRHWRAGGRRGARPRGGPGLRPPRQVALGADGLGVHVNQPSSSGRASPSARLPVVATSWSAGGGVHAVEDAALAARADGHVAADHEIARSRDLCCSTFKLLIQRGRSLPRVPADCKRLALADVLFAP